MKKEVGLIGGVALVVNSIIGSGIFVAPQGVLLDAQSVGMSMVVWVVCGIVASLGESREYHFRGQGEVVELGFSPLLIKKGFMIIIILSNTNSAHCL